MQLTLRNGQCMMQQENFKQYTYSLQQDMEQSISYFVYKYKKKDPGISSQILLDMAP